MKESKLQFSAPVLSEIDFRPNLGGSSSAEATVEHEIQNEIQRKPEEPIAIVTMKIIINAKNEETKESIFSLSMSMKSQFHWNEELDEQTIDQLLKINANTLLMSYSRPIISQIVSLSGLPPYNIPF